MICDPADYPRLSEIRTGDQLNPIMTARFPGVQCPLFGAMTVLPAFAEVKALIIGPAVCTYNVRLALGLRSLTSLPLQDNLLLLTLKQEDIIFGIDSRLKQAIREIDRVLKPGVLFLISTCVPELTGEDLDSIALELCKDVNARLEVIHTDHFSRTDVNAGIERVLAALVSIMEPACRDMNSLNLLGYYQPGFENSELACLLKTRGFKIKRAFPAASPLDSIIAAPDVRLNLVLEQRALLMARRMEEKFGTPYLYCPRPYALDRVDEWYRKIAAALEIDIETEIAGLRAKAEADMAGLSDRLAGNSFALRGVPGSPLAVARLLVDLEMRPAFIHLHQINEEDEEDIRAILSAGFDPPVVFGDNSAEVDRLLAVLKPDFLIPYNYRDIQPAASMGILVRSIEPVSALLGFAVSVQTVRLLSAAGTDFGALIYKEQLLRSGGED